MRRPDATTLRVCLLGWCLALLMTPGHFGSVDAERRLQVARSWWTDEPEVAHDDGDFGIPGRDGQRRAWYGPGQSLVMLVPDMVAVSLVAAVPPAARINQTLDDGLVHALVVLSIAPALAAAVAVLGFGLLQALGFGRPAAVGGVLGLLLATSCLHYLQILQENSLTLALTLGGLYGGVWWWRERSRGALIAGSLALGFNLLVRLTTVFDAAAVLLVLGFLVNRQDDGRRRLLELGAVMIPILALFVGIDRLYHFQRFGEWTSTYIGLFGRAARDVDPSLPASFPFSTPFVEGFSGAFLSPHKSIFLFDPLLFGVLVAGLAGWRSWRTEVRAFVVAVALLIVGHAAFYARYYNWGGDAAWGGRFVVSAVQLLAMVAIPVLMRHPIPRLARTLAWGLIAVSGVVQLASVVFTFNLEIAQVERGAGASFMVGQRLINVWHAATGTVGADPAIRAMLEPAFGPFGWPSSIGGTVMILATTAWFGLLVMTGLVAWPLFRMVVRDEGTG